MRSKRKDKMMGLFAGVMFEMAKYYLNIDKHEVMVLLMQENIKHENKIKELEKKLREKNE